MLLLEDFDFIQFQFENVQIEKFSKNVDSILKLMI